MKEAEKQLLLLAEYIDLLGEVAGVGTYAQASENSDVMELFGFRFQVLPLPRLIAAKNVRRDAQRICWRFQSLRQFMNFRRVDNRIRAIPDRLCLVRKHPFLASRYKLRVEATTTKAAPMKAAWQS